MSRSIVQCRTGCIGTFLHTSSCLVHCMVPRYGGREGGRKGGREGGRENDVSFKSVNCFVGDLVLCVNVVLLTVLLLGSRQIASGKHSHALSLSLTYGLLVVGSISHWQPSHVHVPLLEQMAFPIPLPHWESSHSHAGP